MGILGEVFRQFGEGTSVLPVAHIYAAPSRAVRLLWAALFLLCIALFVRDSHALITQYLDYDKDTVFTVKQSQVRPFPSVTICSINQFKKSAIAKSPELSRLMSAVSYQTQKGRQMGAAKEDAESGARLRRGASEGAAGPNSVGQANVTAQAPLLRFYSVALGRDKHPPRSDIDFRIIMDDFLVSVYQLYNAVQPNSLDIRLRFLRRLPASERLFVTFITADTLSDVEQEHLLWDSMAASANISGLHWASYRVERIGSLQQRSRRSTTEETTFFLQYFVPIDWDRGLSGSLDTVNEIREIVKGAIPPESNVDIQIVEIENVFRKRRRRRSRRQADADEFGTQVRLRVKVKTPEGQNVDFAEVLRRLQRLYEIRDVQVDATTTAPDAASTTTGIRELTATTAVQLKTTVATTQDIPTTTDGTVISSISLTSTTERVDVTSTITPEIISTDSPITLSTPPVTNTVATTLSSPLDANLRSSTTPAVQDTTVPTDDLTTTDVFTSTARPTLPINLETTTTSTEEIPSTASTIILDSSTSISTAAPPSIVATSTTAVDSTTESLIEVTTVAIIEKSTTSSVQQTTRAPETVSPDTNEQESSTISLSVTTQPSVETTVEKASTQAVLQITTTPATAETSTSLSDITISQSDVESSTTSESTTPESALTTTQIKDETTTITQSGDLTTTQALDAKTTTEEDTQETTTESVAAIVSTQSTDITTQSSLTTISDIEDGTTTTAEITTSKATAVTSSPIITSTSSGEITTSRAIDEDATTSTAATSTAGEAQERVEELSFLDQAFRWTPGLADKGSSEYAAAEQFYKQRVECLHIYHHAETTTFRLPKYCGKCILGLLSTLNC